MKRIVLFLLFLAVGCGSVKKQKTQHERQSVIKEDLTTQTQTQVQGVEIQQVKEVSFFTTSKIEITPTDPNKEVTIEPQGEKLIIKGGSVKFETIQHQAEQTSEINLATQTQITDNQQREIHHQTQEKTTQTHKERQQTSRWRWAVLGVILGAIAVWRSKKWLS